MKTKKKLIQEKQNLKKQVQKLNDESVKMTDKWLEEKQDYENKLQQLTQEATITKMKWQEEKRDYENLLQQLKQEAAKTEMKWQEEKRDYENQLQQLKQEAAKIEMKWQEEKRDYETQSQHSEEIIKITPKLKEEKRALENQAHQLKKETLKTTTEWQGEKLSHATQVQQMKLVQGDLQKDVDKLQQKEHNFKETERLKLKVQIFCCQESHFENYLLEEMASLLKKELCQENLELKLLRQSDISEITPTELLLVLCMSLHASDSEIQKAMKGINATRSAAVIMIHLKEPHALPTIPSKRKVREEISTSLGGIFDMAFLRDRDGLYECPMNKRNVGEIVSFIKSFEKMGTGISKNENRE